MRALIAILVAGNLVILAWYLSPGREPDAVRAPDDDRPSSSIVLVEEARTVRSPSASPEPRESASSDRQPEVAAAEPSIACLAIGPFASIDQFDSAAEILRASGIVPRLRSEDGEIWLGHWLYLADVGGPERADELGERLAAAGFRETYFDPSGADGDVLSLGLFRELARAEALRDRVAAAGFEPTLRDRTRSATIYWADFASSERFDPDLTNLQRRGSIVRMEARLCERIDFAAG